MQLVEELFGGKIKFFFTSPHSHMALRIGIGLSLLFNVFGCKKRDYFITEAPTSHLNFYISNFSNDSLYHPSDSILVLPEYGKKRKAIDSVNFFINEKLLKKSDSGLEMGFCISLKNCSIGKNQLKIVTYLNNDESFSFSKDIVVVPENEPYPLDFNILQEYPHDPSHFTQGLIVSGDTIIESTGGYGSSYLKKYNFTTGEVYAEIELQKEDFGEGITEFNGKIYQLTYKENKILIYNKDLSLIAEKPYAYDGWGLTNDDQFLIASDGSAKIYFVNPNGFSLEKTITVYDNQGLVNKINELEYINGKIFANIWQQEYVVVINPDSGVVEYKINFEEFVKSNQKVLFLQNVLNGIAYNKESGNILITGKRWPLLYEITLKGENIYK